MARKPKPRTIGQRIKAIREAKGLNQIWVANKAGMSQGHWSQIENADYDPLVSTLRRIAKALGVKVSELVD